MQISYNAKKQSSISIGCVALLIPQSWLSAKKKSLLPITYYYYYYYLNYILLYIIWLNKGIFRIIAQRGCYPLPSGHHPYCHYGDWQLCSMGGILAECNSSAGALRWESREFIAPGLVLIPLFAGGVGDNTFDHVPIPFVPDIGTPFDGPIG